MQAISWCHNDSIFNFHQKSLIDGKKEKKIVLTWKNLIDLKSIFLSCLMVKYLKKLKNR